MDPPKINFIHNNCLLVINQRGAMRQLFTPFRVKVKVARAHFKLDSWVVVEEVREHEQFIIIYRIGNHWWPFNIFQLIVAY